MELKGSGHVHELRLKLLIDDVERTGIRRQTNVKRQRNSESPNRMSDETGTTTGG
jgi:hypothetical protein